FMLRLSILSLLLSAMAAIAPRFLCAQGGSDKAEATITLHLDQAKTKIAPEVYGQFAEHLGHCIYGGIWVGQESAIPNTRGIRNDVVAALKAIHVPVVR